MADILLTHSYFMSFDPKVHRAMMPYSPLGTLYAAAHLRSKGYKCELFDAMLAKDEEDLLPMLQLSRPKVFVVYDDDFNYLTKMCLGRMRQAAFRMSGSAHGHGCPVIVHGSDPADNVEGYLDHGADYVVTGEGESTLAELVEKLLSGRAFEADTIAGIAYRRDGRVVRTKHRGVISDLDRLPFPARDLVDNERYRRAWIERHGYFSMNIVTTRGCPYHCNWCAKPIYGQVYNSRSPENVVEEMLTLRETYSPDHLWFCDDIFGLKPGWVRVFSEAVRRRDAVIPFKCLSRVDLLLRDGAISDLARAGCESVWVGAESGSQRILDAMEKGTTVEEIYEATAQLHQAGIRVAFFLQYGYPGETAEDILKTLQMVKDCKPDDIGVSVSYPLPGTKFYENVRQNLGDKKNWVDSDDLDLMYAGGAVADFYRALHRVTHKRFRVWQGLDDMKFCLRNPFRLDRRRLRRIVAGAYHALTLPPITARLNDLNHLARGGHPHDHE